MLAIRKISPLIQFLKRVPLPFKKGIVWRLFGKKLSSLGTGWYPVYTGHVWKLDLRNPCHQWMLYDRYADAAFLQWAEKHVPAHGLIVDSGSNIGQFLPYFGKLVPNGKILGLEPSVVLGDWIEACLKVNKLPCELIRKGLGNVASHALLSCGGDEVTHGLWGQVNEENGEPIVVERLDQILRERQIDTVDLWKLDVEGYELQALEGAGGYILGKKIKALYIEMAVKENNNKKILDFMLQHEYKPYYFDVFGNLRTMQGVCNQHMDALFIA